MKHLELFDSVGYDLRPDIRKHRAERKRKALSEESIHTMTLREYVEIRELGMRFDELDDETARCRASTLEFWIYVVNDYGFRVHRRWKLPRTAPIRHCYSVIKAHINMIVYDYEENDGRYGKRGNMTYLRKVLQAIEHGLEIPSKVLDQPIIQANIKPCNKG